MTCKKCNKKGHFARCCNSRSNVRTVDGDSEITAEAECDFITSVSVPEYSVLNIKPSVVKTNQDHKPEYAVKKLEVIKFATGKTRCTEFTLRVDKTFFKATIETGSPASFINKKTADILMKSGAKVKLLFNFEIAHEYPLCRVQQKNNQVIRYPKGRGIFSRLEDKFCETSGN